MICDCGEFINEQSGLCPKCHAEVIKQLAQQQALLDEARDIIENTAWPEGDKAFIFLEKVKILGKEEGEK